MNNHRMKRSGQWGSVGGILLVFAAVVIGAFVYYKQVFRYRHLENPTAGLTESVSNGDLSLATKRMKNQLGYAAQLEDLVEPVIALAKKGKFEDRYFEVRDKAYNKLVDGLEEVRAFSLEGKLYSAQKELADAYGSYYHAIKYAEKLRSAGDDPAQEKEKKKYAKEMVEWFYQGNSEVEASWRYLK